MKLANMRIEGFAYLDDIVIAACQEPIIILQLQDENNSEMVQLKCSVAQGLRKYVINVLLFELMKGQTIIVKFEANYKNFSEVFYTQKDQVDHIVTFDVKLETIKVAYIGGSNQSKNICLKLAA